MDDPQMDDPKQDPPGPGVIEIRVREISQLFNSFDPSPFFEKDLDQEVEDYIVSWAREEPVHKPLVIRVHLTQAEASRPEAHDLGLPLSNYFAYRADMADRELKELFRYGHAALWIGLVVLFACLVGSQLILAWFGSADPLAQLGRESLIILGWVANWEPLQIALYGWWPIVRRRNLYRRLANAEVQVRTR